MKFFSILAFVAATMALTSEAITIRALDESGDGAPVCDGNTEHCDKDTKKGAVDINKGDKTSSWGGKGAIPELDKSESEE